MIRGVAITANRKPTLQFRKEWNAAMAAKKAAVPTLNVYPLPQHVDVVDERGFPTGQFMQLARLFTPALTRRSLVDSLGRPTDYALQWWKEAT
jgi:hypothetical protein